MMESKIGIKRKIMAWVLVLAVLFGSVPLALQAASEPTSSEPTERTAITSEPTDPPPDLSKATRTDLFLPLAAQARTGGGSGSNVIDLGGFNEDGSWGGYDYGDGWYWDDWFWAPGSGQFIIEGDVVISGEADFTNAAVNDAVMLEVVEDLDVNIKWDGAVVIQADEVGVRTLSGGSFTFTMNSGRIENDGKFLTLSLDSGADGGGNPTGVVNIGGSAEIIRRHYDSSNVQPALRSWVAATTISGGTIVSDVVAVEVVGEALNISGGDIISYSDGPFTPTISAQNADTLTISGTATIFGIGNNAEDIVDFWEDFSPEGYGLLIWWDKADTEFDAGYRDGIDAEPYEDTIFHWDLRDGQPGIFYHRGANSNSGFIPIPPELVKVNPAPVTFFPTTVTVDDDSPSQTVYVTGEATGDIKVSYTFTPPSLEDYVGISYEQGTPPSILPSITIKDIRTDYSTGAEGTVNITVEREGEKNSFEVTVNLTALTVTFNPESAEIDDENLTRTVAVGGTAEGDISISYLIPSHLDDYIDITWAAGTPSITIEGTRPATETPGDAKGSFDISVTRQTVTETFTVNVDLTTTWTPEPTPVPTTPVPEPVPRPTPVPRPKPTPRPSPTPTPAPSGAPVWIEMPQRFLDEVQGLDGEFDYNIQIMDETDGILTAEITFTAGGNEVTEFRWRYTVIADLSGLVRDLDQLDQVAAVLDDGTIITGVFDPETGIFAFETNIAGVFTITHAEGLRNFMLRIGSPVIVDLLGGENIIMDTSPVIEDGVPLVPLRFVAYALGAGVLWQGETREVTATMDIRSLTFPIDGALPIVGIPAALLDDRALVPLRFISEFFGATVLWRPGTQSIEVIFIPRQ